MRKTSIILIIVGILTIAGYMAYDQIFPYARPMDEAMDTTKIQSVTILSNENTEEQKKISESDFDKVISLINTAKPTRKMSYNEVPSVETYYTMEIRNGNWTRTCYIYKENGKTYLELPYEGIYRVDELYNEEISRIFEVL